MNKRRFVRNVSKTIEIWVLQGNYGYGWDDLTWGYTSDDIREDYKDYRKNTNIPLRTIIRRVLREDYE